MATSSRRKITRVIDKLFAEPYRYKFFQAVRLLQRITRSKAGTTANDAKPVGYDYAPDKEAVRFSSSARLSYPGPEVQSLKPHTTEKNMVTLPPDMAVNFLGLHGPKGILPTYYTEMVQHRQREKDISLRQFFDLLNHRTISLFYRAWQKYRLPVLFELHSQQPELGETDAITQTLHSLVGHANESVRKNLPIAANNLLYYSGLFCGLRRPGLSLELLLKNCFQIPINIRQFQGEWLEAAVDDRTQLAFVTRRGRNNQLGVNLILGKKVYIVEGKFQLVIGPLSKQQFESIKPGSERLKTLYRLTQSFAGAEVMFNVRMKVSSDAITRFSLGKRYEPVGRLGWNTWLLSKHSTRDNSHLIEEIVLPATGLL